MPVLQRAIHTAGVGLDIIGKLELAKADAVIKWIYGLQVTDAICVPVGVPHPPVLLRPSLALAGEVAQGGWRGGGFLGLPSCCGVVSLSHLADAHYPGCCLLSWAQGAQMKLGHPLAKHNDTGHIAMTYTVSQPLLQKQLNSSG